MNVRQARPRPSGAGAKWRAPKRLVEAELGRILQEERRAEIGAFGDIEPAERGRNVRVGAEGRPGGRRLNAEVGEVHLDQRKTAPFLQAREQALQCRIRIERVDVPVKGVLHPQEEPVDLPAGE